MEQPQPRPPFVPVGVFRKSSYSAGDAGCVDVCHYTDGTVAIRHSRHPDRGEIRVPDTVFETLVAHLTQRRADREGEYEDIAGRIRVASLSGDAVAVADLTDLDAPRLVFTAFEVRAFLRGAGAGEFSRLSTATDS